MVAHCGLQLPFLLVHVRVLGCTVYEVVGDNLAYNIAEFCVLAMPLSINLLLLCTYLFSSICC